jgi:hypothetical protein
MDWIYIGVILNTILSAGFPSEEACLGHKAILQKQNVMGECVKSPLNAALGYTSSGTALMSNCHADADQRLICP